MLGDRDAIATVAVRDLDVARRFYEGTLGLKPEASEQPGVLSFASGRSTVLVYESQYAGTNEATAINWMVGSDVERIAQALAARGVPFEHYEFPGATLDGDVHVMQGMKVAWFRDPDGNILSIFGR
ncbi:MAG TPA: VOC family protein [Gemmatimonadaceae bacterium]|nr:VOC family protein [Gemmatimonadaceae bacterium]